MLFRQSNKCRVVQDAVQDAFCPLHHQTLPTAWPLVPTCAASCTNPAPTAQHHTSSWQLTCLQPAHNFAGHAMVTSVQESP